MIKKLLLILICASATVYAVPPNPPNGPPGPLDPPIIGDPLLLGVPNDIANLYTGAKSKLYAMETEHESLNDKYVLVTNLWIQMIDLEDTVTELPAEYILLKEQVGLARVMALNSLTQHLQQIKKLRILVNDMKFEIVAKDWNEFLNLYNQVLPIEENAFILNVASMIYLLSGQSLAYESIQFLNSY